MKNYYVYKGNPTELSLDKIRTLFDINENNCGYIINPKSEASGIELWFIGDSQNLTYHLNQSWKYYSNRIVKEEIYKKGKEKIKIGIDIINTLSFFINDSYILSYKENISASSDTEVHFLFVKSNKVILVSTVNSFDEVVSKLNTMTFLYNGIPSLIDLDSIVEVTDLDYLNTRMTN